LAGGRAETGKSSQFNISNLQFPASNQFKVIQSNSNQIKPKKIWLFLILCSLSLLPGLQSARGAGNLEIAEFHARADNMTATAISNDGQFV